MSVSPRFRAQGRCAFRRGGLRPPRRRPRRTVPASPAPCMREDARPEWTGPEKPLLLPSHVGRALQTFSALSGSFSPRPVCGLPFILFPSAPLTAAAQGVPQTISRPTASALGSCRAVLHWAWTHSPARGGEGRPGRRAAGRRTARRRRTAGRGNRSRLFGPEKPCFPLPIEGKRILPQKFPPLLSPPLSSTPRFGRRRRPVFFGAAPSFPLQCERFQRASIKLQGRISPSRGAIFLPRPRFFLGLSWTQQMRRQFRIVKFVAQSELPIVKKVAFSNFPPRNSQTRRPRGAGYKPRR